MVNSHWVFFLDKALKCLQHSGKHFYICHYELQTITYF